jgi:chromosome segregation ATPase
MADRWATYEEAGEAFGLSAEAMRKRARRLGWRVMPGNDGKARVLVPDGAGLGPDGRGGRPAGRPDGRADDPQALGALADALRQEREGRQTAEAAAARAEGEAAGLREAVRLAPTAVQLEQALGRAEREATRAAVLEAEAVALRENLLRAEAKARAEVRAFRDAAAQAEARLAEATSLIRQVIGQLEATARERIDAQARAVDLRQHLDRAEAERDSARTDAAVLRDAEARAAARVAAERAARKAAEAAEETARGELAALTEGGPLRRARRAFVFRRGRP